MIKLAGAEDSGITDRITGKRVYVTVTARKKFRQANPTWARVRNQLLNSAIATDFARSEPQEKSFRVRSSPGAVGQVRDGFGGQYIAIIDSNSIRVITVGKGGTPKISVPAPAAPPASQTPTPVSLGSAFNDFLVKHSASNELGADSGIADAIQMLSNETGISVNKLIEQIKNHPDREELLATLSSIYAEEAFATNDMIHHTENKNMFITDPLYEQQGALPSSALSTQVGLAVR